MKQKENRNFTQEATLTDANTIVYVARASGLLVVANAGVLRVNELIVRPVERKICETEKSNAHVVQNRDSEKISMNRFRENIRRSCDATLLDAALFVAPD